MKEDPIVASLSCGHIFIDDVPTERRQRQALWKGLAIISEGYQVYIRPAYGMEMDKRRGGHPDCPYVAVKTGGNLANDRLWHCQNYDDAIDAAISLI